MLLRTFASSVDDAFLAWSVRPSLPHLSVRSSLRSLAVAEQRTHSEIPEAALFSPAATPECAPTPGSLGRSDHQELIVACELPRPALATGWGISGIPRELVTRFYVRGAPRPLVILMSGWSPTSRIGPSLIWPLRRLDRAGFDVAVPALPWAMQLDSGTATFPGSDPCWNIVTAAITAVGLAQLVRHSRNRGHPALSMFAMSLGAHLAALFATLPEAELVDQLILEKPLGQLSDLIRWHARGDPVWCHHVADRLQRVYRWVCPLDRTSRIAPERVTVAGAEFDRVTPMVAAQAVADHFHVPLRPIRASHLFDPGHATRVLRLLTEKRVHNADYG